MCFEVEYSICFFLFPGFITWFYLFFNQSEAASCNIPDCRFRQKHYILNPRVYGTGDPHKVAIIVIDMWNWHWCMTMSERISSMVPRMNAILNIARNIGMQVIWNPSEVTQFHSGSIPHAMGMSIERRLFPCIRPSLPVRFTAPIAPCLCGPGFTCTEYYAWDGMEPNLMIDDHDLFSVNGADIYSLLSDRGITSIIFMGAATNMCVFQKPGALDSMFRAGFYCVLAKDVSDAFTKYDPRSGYTPDSGAVETASNYVAAGIQTVNLGDDFIKAGYWHRDTPLDLVRFVPWGKLSRPYVFRKSVVVTLTAPWLIYGEIRYTMDGSTPISSSQRYSIPLIIKETRTLRAAAFENGKCVSLFSDAYYTLLPLSPPPPEIHLEQLSFQRPAHAARVKGCFWGRQHGIRHDFHARGVVYGHGMELRVPSSVIFAIHPHYSRFVALVGIDDSMWTKFQPCLLVAQSAVIFRVFVDGTLVAQSPVMRLYQEPWSFDVALPLNSRHLILAMMDPWPRNLIAYGNWLNAGFRLRRAQNLSAQDKSLGRAQSREKNNDQ